MQLLLLKMPFGSISAWSQLVNLTAMQVLRCLRMDRVTVGITRYVIAKMSDKYVQPPTLDYSAIYRQSTQMTPIVFVLSPGADPAFDVFKLGTPPTPTYTAATCHAVFARDTATCCP